MPIDDEQLDDMLRDVSVPQDLKAKLLEIPDRDSEAVVASDSSHMRTTIVGTMMAIAALILVFLYIEPSQVAKVEPQADNAEAIAMLVEDMQRNQESIDEILNAQTDAIEGRALANTSPVFDPDETLALALSMSWQASLERGASVEVVKDELEFVVTQYPNTNGAQRARELLQIN